MNFDPCTVGRGKRHDCIPGMAKLLPIRDLGICHESRKIMGRNWATAKGYRVQ